MKEDNSQKEKFLRVQEQERQRQEEEVRRLQLASQQRRVSENQRTRIFEPQRLPIRPPQLFKCQFCLKPTQNESHLNECAERPFPCEYCGEKYPKSLVGEHEQQCPVKNQHATLIKNLQGGQQPEERKDQQQRQQHQQHQQQQQEQRHPQRPSQRRGNSVQKLLSGAGQLFINIATGVYQNFFNQTSRNIPQILHPPRRDQEPSLHELMNEMVQEAHQLDALSRQRQEQLSLQIPLRHQESSGESVKFAFHQGGNLSPSAKSCAICQCEYEEGECVKLLKCTHRYHDTCIDSWLKKKNNCPICKTKVTN